MAKFLVQQPSDLGDIMKWEFAGDPLELALMVRAVMDVEPEIFNVMMNACQKYVEDNGANFADFVAFGMNIQDNNFKP